MLERGSQRMRTSVTVYRIDEHRFFGAGRLALVGALSECVEWVAGHDDLTYGSPYLLLNWVVSGLTIRGTEPL